MKVSAIKGKNDENSFKLFKNLGMNVFEIEDYDKVDEAINSLINNDYKTIFISGELAGFSEDIIKKYDKKDNINIIIAPIKE